MTKMQIAVTFLVLPLLCQAELTEVTKCFATTDEGIKIGDGQCENAFGDAACDDIFENSINNGLSNSQVDKRCYDDQCLSSGCLKKCLMCCEDPKYNCSNVASETTCSALKGCGACDRDALTGMMVKNCPKTCGYCELQGKPLPEKCNDKESQCERLQNLLSCNTEFMRNNCAKTCSVPCTASNASTSTSTVSSTSTRPSTTPTAQTTTTSSSRPTTTVTTQTTTKTTTTTTFTTTTTVTIRCNQGWTGFDGTYKCYKSFTEKKNFDKTVDACKEANGSLVLPRSKSEYDFVTKNVVPDPSIGERTWIGVKKQNGEFSALNGDKLNFENWGSGEPSGDGDCVHMIDYKAITGWNYYWNDMSCDRNNSFICEKAPEGGDE